ncbi:MAG: FAD-binding domain-containing protein, partial [Sediminibacterium sp.]
MPNLDMQNEQPLFPTDYVSIMQRVDAVDPIKYARTRNFIHGDVTYLSAYIARGVISVKQIMEAVLQKGYKPYAIEKFLQELAWREYYQRVWQVKKEDIFSDLKQEQPDYLHYQIPAAIVHAATGIQILDNQINAFYTTGYLHNHIRMYLASIVCNNAKSHWLAPARWMYYHLLDGDLASNSCSWQWVAGSFSSKKYYCNQENINKYTSSNQRHTFLDDSYEHIATMPVPKVLEATSTPTFVTNLPQTAVPKLDTSKSTLLYNSYNLDPLWRADESVNRVLILEPSHFNKYPVSDKVINFIIDLSKNISGIEIYVGEVDSLVSQYKNTDLTISNAFISKEHPAFEYYPGIK